MTLESKFWLFLTSSDTCFCSSVRNRGTNFEEIRLVFQSSIRTHYHVSYERPNLLVVSKKILCWPSLMILWTFYTFSYVQPVEGRCDCLQTSTELFSCMNQEHHWKVCVLLMVLSLKAVFCISRVSDSVFPSLKQNLTQMCCSFKSAITKSWIALDTHKNKHTLRATQRVMVEKTH